MLPVGTLRRPGRPRPAALDGRTVCVRSGRPRPPLPPSHRRPPLGWPLGRTANLHANPWCGHNGSHDGQYAGYAGAGGAAGSGGYSRGRARVRGESHTASVTVPAPASFMLFLAWWVTGWPLVSGGTPAGFFVVQYNF